MKTSDLTGITLDYWVAKAEGHEPSVDSQLKFTPSTSWAQGGPIIERNKISVIREQFSTNWYASADIEVGNDWHIDGQQFGDTALIAAMRAVVAQKFGDDVPDA